MPEWWLHGLRRTRRPASTNDWKL